MTSRASIPAASMDDLTDIYIVANTPSYLYKTLRASAAVSSLASRFEGTALAAIYDKAANKQKRTLKDVVTAYSALVAITLKDRTTAMNTLGAMDLARLDWADGIKNAFLESPSHTQVVMNASVPPSLVYSYSPPAAIELQPRSGSPKATKR